jgi:putative aldouronate transport system permease protein
LPFAGFLLPGLVFFLVFHYLPIYGLIGAFQNYNPVLGFFKSEFTGLENFRVLFALPDFWMVFRNTVWISFWNLVFTFPAPIIFALLIAELNHSGFKRGVQTVSYIPHFISWVVVSGIWYKLSASTGIINDFLTGIGIVAKPVYFMTEPQYFVPVVVVTSLWKSVGFNAIIYLAALTAINPELYEAADIDGCRKLQKIRYITLPGIKPTIILLFILAVSNILQINFEQLWTLQNAAIYRVSEVIDTYIFRILMQGQFVDYARGIAFGLIRAAICTVLFFVGNATMKRAGLGSLF